MDPPAEDPVIALLLNRVHGLPKKQVPTLFQWSKQAVVHLCLGTLTRKVLSDTERCILVLEECGMYLQENLCPGILKEILHGVDVGVAKSMFLGFIPFGNQHLRELDLTHRGPDWATTGESAGHVVTKTRLQKISQKRSPFELSIAKKLLKLSVNLTTIIMPDLANDQIVLHLSKTCRNVKILDLGMSHVTDLGVSALAGYEVDTKERIFRRVRPGLRDLRQLGLDNGNPSSWDDAEIIERACISVEAIVLLLETFENIEVLKYANLPQALSMCKRNGNVQSIPLHYIGSHFFTEEIEDLYTTGFLPKLTRLDLVCNMAEHESLLYLKHLNRLTDFRFRTYSDWLPRSSLDQIATLTQLQTLCIATSIVRSSDLMLLRAQCPSVRILSIKLRRFNEDVAFQPGPGWEKLNKLKVEIFIRERYLTEFVGFSLPTFCIGNCEKLTKLCILSYFRGTSNELGRFLSDEKLRNLECLSLAFSMLPSLDLVCVALTHCPNLKKIIWKALLKDKHVVELLKDYLKKNNVDLQLFPSFYLCPLLHVENVA